MGTTITITITMASTISQLYNTLRECMSQGHEQAKKNLVMIEKRLSDRLKELLTEKGEQDVSFPEADEGAGIQLTSLIDSSSSLFNSNRELQQMSPLRYVMYISCWY